MSEVVIFSKRNYYEVVVFLLLLTSLLTTQRPDMFECNSARADARSNPETSNVVYMFASDEKAW